MRQLPDIIRSTIKSGISSPIRKLSENSENEEESKSNQQQEITSSKDSPFKE
jgi:hypothetical protein